MKKIIKASNDARQYRKAVTAASDDPIFNELSRQLNESGIPFNFSYDGVPELICCYPEYENGDIPGAVGNWISDTQMNYPDFFNGSDVDACEGIMGADGEGATGGGYDDAVKDLQADFDYVIEGLDKMSRMGGAKEKEALALVLEFSSQVTGMINTVAGSVTE